MPGKDRDQIQNLFATRGLRCTAQRRALYKALAASTCHPTADQLYYEVSGHVPGMSLATVYNTLEAFCHVNLAQKLPGVGGSTRYDAIVQNHVHTRCEDSEAVFDVPDDLSQKILKSIPRNLLTKVEAEMGFKVDQVKIELVGQYIGR